MKVTTDGCIFGAVINAIASGNILDIGTGTGLLALMLAQRTDAQIHALEIDSKVAQQAKENVLHSPWPNQIKVLNVDFQNYHPQAVYDQIICNPPFFKNSFKGRSELKNTAIHNDSLPMESLLEQSQALLTDQGCLWVMYPEYEMSRFEKIATDSDLSLSSQTFVYNTFDTPIFRVISEFRKMTPKEPHQSELIIKEHDGSYTKSFHDLLKDYYLHL